MNTKRENIKTDSVFHRRCVDYLDLIIKKKKNTPKIIRFHKRVNQNHELIPFTAQTLPSIRTTANNSKRVTFYK